MTADDAEEAADPITIAWENVDRAWDDHEAHRRFIALCRALGRLPDAGKRYRQVRDAIPSRRESAQERIDELIAAATLELEARRSQPPRDARRYVTFAALLVMLAMMAIVAFALARMT